MERISSRAIETATIPVVAKKSILQLTFIGYRQLNELEVCCGTSSPVSGTSLPGRVRRHVHSSKADTAACGEQPHALDLALDGDSIAIVLDFVQPVLAGGDFRPSGRNTGFDRRITIGR